MGETLLKKCDGFFSTDGLYPSSGVSLPLGSWPWVGPLASRSMRRCLGWFQGQGETHLGDAGPTGAAQGSGYWAKGWPRSRPEKA